MIFQSTPSVKRVTALSLYFVVFFCISIHTLCEEGDAIERLKAFEPEAISIHTLCEEGDYNKEDVELDIPIISIHTLCEEGDVTKIIRLCFRFISIHTLCEEGDKQLCFDLSEGGSFQSTPSVKRVTIFIKCFTILILRFQSTPSVKRVPPQLITVGKYWKISIHTLYEEGDVNNFDNWQNYIWFQSTPSVKRVTLYNKRVRWFGYISIHTLCEEGDSWI